MAAIEDGGILDADWWLDQDLRTYSWLWGLANTKMDENEREAQRAQELLESRRK